MTDGRRRMEVSLRNTSDSAHGAFHAAWPANSPCGRSGPGLASISIREVLFRQSFDQEFAAADTSLVIDLYRVADAVPVEGYDTYDWSMNQPFSSLTIDKEIDSAGWKVLAQQAADLVLGKAPEGENEWDPSL